MTFEPTWESLEKYQCPDWFRDAKFGIWAHWGPQCVPMIGDWYARNMYLEGYADYEHHCKHYGHPSEFGYKDLIKLWKAERFDPEHLMSLYQKAGAKYFTACAVHCDNYDCWDSKHHKWNSVNVGPNKDIVGQWAKAARNQGMRFGVTEHVERAYSWFNTNKNSDKKGPKAGVPYDGNDPAYENLYFPPHDDANFQYPVDPPQWWQKQWADRIKDVVDQHKPDLLYTDGGIPFGEVGRDVIAHYYNGALKKNGQLEAVYTYKNLGDAVFKMPAAVGAPCHSSSTHDAEGNPFGGHGDYRPGVGVLDLERGGLNDIADEPWQTDTCVGEWYYKKGITYKSPRLVIHMLADIVSKNGNLLLNFPPHPDGTLDQECLDILDALADWFNVNGEAIYGTRPWTRYGQGADFPAGDLSEPSESPLGFGDFRFTTQGGNTLYAIALGWPADAEHWDIENVGDRRVANVELLGPCDSLTWSQNDQRVRVAAPVSKPCDLAYSLKLTFA